MKSLTLFILLALAPLSYGFTFNDGTKLKGNVESYIFLECKIVQSIWTDSTSEDLMYRRYFSIFVDKKRAYFVDSKTKGWSILYPMIEENRISFTDDRRYVPTVTLDRTTLQVTDSQSFKQLSCGLTDHKSVDAWLTKIRAQRRI